MLHAIITNKDIDSIKNKSIYSPEEVTLLAYRGALETTIQSHARNYFINLRQEMMIKHLGACYGMHFIQLDNGANLSAAGKIRKWREGTVKGFPDVMILLSRRKVTKSIFIEFKRIGTPSQICISEAQENWNTELQSMGFSAYITNNPLFFMNVICEEIREFFAVREQEKDAASN